MKRTFLTGTLFVILISGIVLGQIPKTMSYQGVLKNSDGTLVSDGNYSLIVKLYDSETATTALWTETHSTVSVSNGIFSVILGSVGTLELSFDKQYWLGVTVGADSEMSPRVKLTSAPYSLNALSVLGTGNTFPSSGNVGIGTTAPGAKLDVEGDMRLLNGGVINEFSTDGTLSGNSDSAVPTEKAVKTYVDARDEVIEDTTPQLGGDLDVNGKKIKSNQNSGDVLMEGGLGTNAIGGDVTITAGITSVWAGSGSKSIASIAGGSADGWGTGGQVKANGVPSAGGGSFDVNGGTVEIIGGNGNNGVGGDIYLLPGSGTSEGNVGIGTTAPGSMLVIKGSGTTSGTSALDVTDGGGTSLLYVRDDGHIGFGTTNPFYRVFISENDPNPAIGVGNSGNGHAIYAQAYGTGYGIYGYNSSSGVGGFFSSASGYGLIVQNGNVGIGTTSPNSTLETNGSFATSAISTVTANYTITASDYVILADNNTIITITLPTAVGIKGRKYIIKRIASVAAMYVTIDPTGSETIDGSTSVDVGSAQWEWIEVISDGANWLKIGSGT